jgi:hypothetical protein
MYSWRTLDKVHSETYTEPAASTRLPTPVTTPMITKYGQSLTTASATLLSSPKEVPKESSSSPKKSVLIGNAVPAMMPNRHDVK